MGHGKVDKPRGQRFKSLAVGDGRLQSGGFRGWNTTTEVAPVLPDLMFEVGATSIAGRAVPEFRFEAALFHGVEGAHLLKNLRPLREKISVHAAILSIS